MRAVILPYENFSEVYRSAIKNGVPPDTDFIMRGSPEQEADIMKYVFKKTYPVKVFPDLDLQAYDRVLLLSAPLVDASVRQYFSIAIEEDTLYEDEENGVSLGHSSNFYFEETEKKRKRVYEPSSPCYKLSKTSSTSSSPSS